MNSGFWNTAASVTTGVALALRRLRKRPILAYSVAIVLIGLASLLQWQLREHYAGAPFLIIYPAVILATFAGGLGGGIFSAILAGASQFWFFIPDFHWLALGTYGFDATICVVLILWINGTIETLVTKDALTGLPNRTLFDEQLQSLLKRARRGERFAVLYLDVDHLKRVNETLGHPVGDKLIQGIANRLRGCVRDIDLVARLNGDEFAIVQTRLEDLSDTAELAGRVRDAIREPFRLHGHEVRVDVSVGIAIAPDDANSVNDLLQAADIAVFAAKSAGRGTYCYYQAEMNDNVQRRSSLERALQGALANGEFELFYQPIVSLKEGRIKAFEALLRWRHPERGLISPAEFIPIAEENGFIVPLGEWVLRRACAAAASWNTDVNVAVNVSPVQLASGSLIDAVKEALESAGLSPDRLTIEITESIFLENTSRNLEILERIREIGVRFSMDDFGAGYSSLTYLLSFRFNEIKIDQRFIAELPARRESRAIVRAIADLACSLNIRVVAEGVETLDQEEEARALGCTDVQGYFISVPVPESEIGDVLQTYELDAARARSKVA